MQHLILSMYYVYLVPECRNLPPMDPNGLADPFVKLCLISNEGLEVSLIQKSEKKSKTLEPVFDESFFM